MKEEFEKYIIDINIYKLIRAAFEEDFNRDESILGCSNIAFCPRKTIIIKIYFPGERIKSNMKMLHGKIHHNVIQNKKVLKPLLLNICKKLKIDPRKVKYKTEREFKFEIIPDTPYTDLLKDKKTYIEGHVDIWSNFFIIEIKTTDMPLEYYGHKVAPFHFIQTNLYLGYVGKELSEEDKNKLAYLLSLNLRGYRSSLDNIEDVWRKYGYLLPVLYSEDLFNQTIERAKLLFKMIDKKDFNLAGPSFNWECKTCEEKIKKICGRDKNE